MRGAVNRERNPELGVGMVDRKWGLGSRWGYLGGCDGLETGLPPLCEIAGDFDGVGRAAEVWVHPVGTCGQYGGAQSVGGGEGP